MQTCSQCNANSPDLSLTCPQCGADLKEFSTRAVALKHMQENPRVRAVRVTVADNACSSCYTLMNTYPKDKVPSLPHLSCSHKDGCRCFYEPVLEDTALVGKVVE